MAGYETEEQAREAAAGLIERVRIARETGESGTQAQANYLAGALMDAGVELGGFDARILGWLAGWEPETVQAVVRWIESAAAGKAR